MIIGRLTIPSGARRWYTVNFPWMAVDEFPAAVPTYYVTTEPGAEDEAIPEFTVDSVRLFDPQQQAVQFRAGGGIDGTVYTVHLQTASTDGQTSPDCVVFEIDNGGC